MQVNATRGTNSFNPGSLTIKFENAQELDLLKRVFGLTDSIPRALKADAKQPARDLCKRAVEALRYV